MTVSCTISGGLVITFISSVLVEVDFFLLKLYHRHDSMAMALELVGRTSAMSTLYSNERNKILPNKFLIRHAEISLPSPTSIFLVLASVPNEYLV